MLKPACSSTVPRALRGRAVRCGALPCGAVLLCATLYGAVLLCFPFRAYQTTTLQVLTASILQEIGNEKKLQYGVCEVPIMFGFGILLFPREKKILNLKKCRTQTQTKTPISCIQKELGLLFRVWNRTMIMLARKTTAFIAPGE